MATDKLQTDTDGKLRIGPSGKAILDSGSDPCCCDGAECVYCSAPVSSYLLTLDSITLTTGTSYTIYKGTAPETWSNRVRISSPATLSGEFCLTYAGGCVWECYDYSGAVEYQYFLEVVGKDETEYACLKGLHLRLEKYSDTEALLTVRPITPNSLGIFDIFRKTITTSSGECFPAGPHSNEYVAADPITFRNIDTQGSTANLGYDGTATLADGPCDPCDECAYVTGPIYAEGKVPFVDATTGLPATIAAGTYDVEYLCGALKYTPSSNFSVNYSSEIKFEIVDASDNVLATAPGGTTQYGDQAAVEAAHSGDTASITHPGGILYIRLVDTNYADNSLDPRSSFASPPKFRVCAPVAVCPSDCSACDSPIVATITDFADADCVFCDERWNTTATLTRTGCGWDGTDDIQGDPVTLTCTDGVWTLLFETGFCGGTDPSWTAPATGDGDCPPATGWTFAGTTDQCGTGTLTLS